MRKFYINVDGERIDLNGKGAGILLASPSGFGVSFDNSITNYCSGYGYVSEEKQSLGQIVGTLIIFRSADKVAYQCYRDFASKLIKAKELIFEYIPEEGHLERSGYSNVKLNYLTKGESHLNDYILVPVAFDMLSPWYRDTSVTILNNETKTVTIELGDAYDAAIYYTSNKSLQDPVLEIISETDSEKSVKVAIAGACTGMKYFNSYENSFITDHDGNDILTKVDLANNIFTHPSGDTLTVKVPNVEFGSFLTVRRYWRSL